MILIEYDKCSTCKNAKKYLNNNIIKYDIREVNDATPTKDELSNWITKYNISIDKLFNTSGLVYRELGLKDKLKSMDIDDKLSLLSSNGMLIKRPLLISDDKMLVGFKIKEWDEYFLNRLIKK